jgi:hypothetical protein
MVKKVTLFDLVKPLEFDNELLLGSSIFYQKIEFGSNNSHLPSVRPTN